MKRKSILGIAVAVVAVILAMAITRPSTPAPAPEVPIPHPYFEAVGIVTRVIDGDTISVRLTWVEGSTKIVAAGREERVRLSGGVDAPELGQEGGPEAAGFIVGLCPIGTGVLLDLDEKATHGAGPYRDEFGRLLAVVYIWTDKTWVNVNAELLRWGLKAWPQHDWLKYVRYPSEFDPHEWLAENYPCVRKQGP